MSKKLNPGLFESQIQPQTTEMIPTPPPQQPISSAHPTTLPTLQPPPNMDMHKILEEVQSVKTRLRNSDQQIETLKNQLSEFIASIDQRFERFSQALSRLEKGIHIQERNTEDKIRKTHERIQAQGFEESKVESLVERQTLVVRNFENRLNSLQKVVHEQELLLMKYFETLRNGGFGPDKGR